MVVVYDHILTFSQEIDLIWSRRWSFMTLLYFLARYSVNVVNSGAHHSLPTAWSIVLTWGYTVNINIVMAGNWSINIFATVMDAILLVRAYALCNQSKITLCILLICFFVQMVVVFILMGTEYNAITIRKFVQYVGAPIGSVTQDIGENITAFVPPPLVVTVVQLAFNIIVFGFAMSAFVRHARESKELHGRWSVSPLLKLLIHDQMIYFFCYVVWQALDLPVDAPGLPQNQALTTIADALDALVIIAGPRMVISLRAQETKLVGERFQTEFSTINFGAGEVLSLQPMNQTDPETTT
ncbi:hypothetical protein BJ138DRAFT_424659 [Hygrophoropsis aurantiaca]|uniref:Uncharacterized protein n=1 Tax=Hygrophoropsis aurantiaca TaxID=72124 RepID=A0ACB8A4B9_9AGAM|nr:hypothetical protein BJ138DRAFT_424659 [Hygrophoropsis aurantiaca]